MTTTKEKWEKPTIREVTDEGPVVVRIVGIANPNHPIAQMLDDEHAGRWIAHYNPYTEAGDPPDLETTDDKAKAIRFPTFAHWHRLYRTANGTRPWDGEPNRPITAFHLEISRVDD
jgi:hypothetical protein